MGIDGDRATCLDCLSTLVRNTADAQPLYDDVLGLYASFGMPLPVRPPLLLVGATCQVLMLSPCWLQLLLIHGGSICTLQGPAANEIRKVVETSPAVGPLWLSNKRPNAAHAITG